MWGTILNAGAIVAGGAAGLTLGKDLSAKTQVRLKAVLGVLVVYVGLKTTWTALNGTFRQILKQIAIMLLALILGNIVGKVLRLQKLLNKLGEHARNALQKSAPGESRFAEGFVTCTILFCVGPMAIIGSLRDGLDHDIRILGIKSAMDGLATMAFVKTFGWGVICAALPVLAYQGSITLAAGYLAPYLQNGPLADSISAVGGLLVLCTALIIFDIQKVPLADYLPSLVIAPLLTWWWK
jgi:uncharacterized membrane protein YqgA involved in biofilm formation